jgi:hypothetical protein
MTQEMLHNQFLIWNDTDTALYGDIKLLCFLEWCASIWYYHSFPHVLEHMKINSHDYRLLWMAFNLALESNVFGRQNAHNVYFNHVFDMGFWIRHMRYLHSRYVYSNYRQTLWSYNVPHLYNVENDSVYM